MATEAMTATNSHPDQDAPKNLERAPAGQRKAALSPSRQSFIELMQKLGYGRIEQITVVNGEPVLEPKPKVVLDIKFGSEESVPVATAHDFALKKQVIEFFACLERIGTGSVSCLHVKAGLPFKLELERFPQ